MTTPSVINTLKSGKVCRVTPIPGETMLRFFHFSHDETGLQSIVFEVWQCITLTRRIYLIDCPGIVPASAHGTQTAKVLKGGGVVRVKALARHRPDTSPL